MQKKKNISEAEAINVLGPQSRSSYIYRESYSIDWFGFAGGGVEYGFLAKIYTSGSFRCFDSIVSDWELPASSGCYIVTNGCHYQTIGNPVSQCSDYGRSQLQVTVTYSTQAEVSAGINAAIQAGFSLSSQTGFTCYFRKTKSFSRTYSVY